MSFGWIKLELGMKVTYKINAEEEKEFKRVFNSTLSAELWVAKYGHRVMSGDFRNCIFSDKEFQNWLHEVYRLLHGNSIEDRDRSF